MEGVSEEVSKLMGGWGSTTMCAWCECDCVVE